MCFDFAQSEINIYGCGMSKNQKRFFMVNGNDSYPNEFPWFAVISKIHLNDRLERICGRTIINHRRIVTAT